jgi:hypothetical protein
VLLLALLVLAMSVAACGTAASTSPPTASPSVSASAPPTEAESATAYLLAVKRIWVGMGAINVRVAKVATVKEVNKSQSVRDAHAHTVKKLAKKLANLQIDLNLIDVPTSMRKAQPLYVAYLAASHLAYTTIVYSLSAHLHEAEWGLANSEMTTANKSIDRANAKLEAFTIEVKTQAKKLGIKVPWKWRG